MSEQIIELKGSSFTLSMLNLGSASLNQIRAALTDKIAQAPQFFDRAPLIVNVGKLDSAIDFAGLKELLDGLNLIPVGVAGCHDPQQKRDVKSAGLAVMTPAATQTAPPPQPEPQPVPEPEIIEKHIPVASTRFHDGPVRSGQQIYAKDANLVITGVVSNGAEVIADGSIHIYGPLRGRALAGAKGDTDSRIYCSDLQAELLSIAGNYRISETLQQQYIRQAVCIRLDEEQLVISQLK